MYACFDQPDLKAIFALRRSPRRRTGRSSATAPVARRPTPARATSAVTFDDDAGDVDLHHRPGRRAVPRGAPDATTASTSACTAASRWRGSSTPTSCSSITAQGFDFYHRVFDYRYPFGKYDQLFVPEFNAGRDGERRLRDLSLRSYVFRAQGHRRHPRAAGRDDPARDGAHVVRRPRDHALVGRPVAQRELRDVHVGALPGLRHPLDATPGRPSPTPRRPGRCARTSCPRRTRSSPTPATWRPCETNFDGITYAKGASVLKQLVAWVGPGGVPRRAALLFPRARVRQHHAA